MWVRGAITPTPDFAGIENRTRAERDTYSIIVGLLAPRFFNLPPPLVHTYYRTRVIITRGFYILTPLFEGQKHFFDEVFSENSAYMYG